eukprot:Gb_05720 [translate_table: standard]
MLALTMKTLEMFYHCRHCRSMQRKSVGVRIEQNTVAQDALSACVKILHRFNIPMQKAFQTHITHCHFKKLKRATIFLQSLVRSMRARKEYIKAPIVNMLAKEFITDINLYSINEVNPEKNTLMSAIRNANV